MTSPSLGEELFDACRDADLARLRALVPRASAEDLAWQEPNSGWTPLHMAAEMADVELVEVLIQAGAPLDVRDAHGQTPLHIAVDSEVDGAHQSSSPLSLLVTRALVQAGADVDARAHDGRTPADWARSSGCAEAEALLTRTPHRS